MTNKDLVEATKDIVIAMINTGHLDKENNRTSTKDICNAISAVYKELNSLTNSDNSDLIQAITTDNFVV